jgi:hypothetical protein
MIKHWAEDQYPLDNLDKIPTEDKIIMSREEQLFIPGEELIAIAEGLYEELPKEHQKKDIFDALLDAVIHTRDKFINRR